MSASDIPAILVQGTADWNQPIATNQHYMVRELARLFPVTFVESLGLRRPELSRSDIRRAARRLTSRGGGSGTARALPDRVNVLSPKVIPIHAAPWVHFNKQTLKRQLSGWVDHSGPKIYWTYSPVTYGFEGAADISIYHCVDLYGQYPGIDADLMDTSERRLARSGVIAVGSSEVVVEHLKRQGFTKVHYWPNVADTAEIRRVADETESSERSGVIFAGNLSEKKVDFGILRALVEQGVELHLAGPVAEGGGRTKELTDELVSAGANYHGMLTLTELSRLMLNCKVGLIPYQINGYTNGVSPLKTYEYLAAGLSVVASRLPGVTAIEPHVVTSQDADEFIAQVVTAIETWRDDEIADRLVLAQDHSWKGRGIEARTLLENLLQPIGAKR
jgi:teichuronic acid biosynthesis glycosyltransferase TuaH